MNVKVTRLKLDVLKPHQPNVLEFATGLASARDGCSIEVRVLEMDDKTETLEVVIQGDDIQFDQLVETINGLGGSLHSIDEVTVSPASAPSRG